MPVAHAPTDEELLSHPVVSRAEWLAARRELLAREKEVTKLIDDLSARRRALPWVKVDKAYAFDTAGGKQTLSDLFEGRSQLIVYHFMFGPDWEEGCDGCSFLCDHVDGVNRHLPHHDVTLLAVSRAPLEKLSRFRERMGWRFKWVSSHGSDFNFDFHASSLPEQIASGKILYNFAEIDSEDAGEEHHGVSVFYKNRDGEVYHTYSCYSRGADILCGAHNFLDLTPKGRNEKSTMDWVRLHDEYETKPPADSHHFGP